MQFFYVVDFIVLIVVNKAQKSIVSLNSFVIFMRMSALGYLFARASSCRNLKNYKSFFFEFLRSFWNTLNSQYINTINISHQKKMIYHCFIKWRIFFFTNLVISRFSGGEKLWILRKIIFSTFVLEQLQLFSGGD